MLNAEGRGLGPPYKLTRTPVLRTATGPLRGYATTVVTSGAETAPCSPRVPSQAAQTYACFPASSARNVTVYVERFDNASYRQSCRSAGGCAPGVCATHAQT